MRTVEKGPPQGNTASSVGVVVRSALTVKPCELAQRRWEIDLKRTGQGAHRGPQFAGEHNRFRLESPPRA